MADLETAMIATVSSTIAPEKPAEVGAEEFDVVVVKFVLDSVIDLLEGLVLQGDNLKHAGQILRDVEDLRKSL